MKKTDLKNDFKKKNGRDFQKIAVSDSGYLYVPESPLTSPTMWIRPGLPGPYITH